MPSDHNRPLPVSPERLAAVAEMLFPGCLWPQRNIAGAVYTVALLGEQVEQTERVAFFLQEAYEIYNFRFR